MLDGGREWWKVDDGALPLDQTTGLMERDGRLGTTQDVRPKPAFDVNAVLRGAGIVAASASYRVSEVIFRQGDAADSVCFIEEGHIKLSVMSASGKEAVVAMLEAGDFFGESALAGRAVRLASATAATATTVLVIPKEQMIRVLHGDHAFSSRFIAHVLARNIRMESDLIDQLLNSSEQRLARTLLLLANYGKPGQARRVLPTISQKTLAEMIGTTRSRVNFFMKRFKHRGFIEDDGGLKINQSLLTVIRENETVDARQMKAS